eukprot:TRINITY_DN2758_c1_g1_i1.p1 TRINITY_DN2758_c1_g1~~TRINITY_DN2758_c1_g1_i1.p1  ORF type:complete len:936 (-),score=248.64 TRINITY_DN2758_c1_g1_i1:31-2838(-)
MMETTGPNYSKRDQVRLFVHLEDDKTSVKQYTCHREKTLEHHLRQICRVLRAPGEYKLYQLRIVDPKSPLQGIVTQEELESAFSALKDGTRVTLQLSDFSKLGVMLDVEDILRCLEMGSSDPSKITRVKEIIQDPIVVTQFALEGGLASVINIIEEQLNQRSNSNILQISLKIVAKCVSMKRGIRSIPDPFLEMLLPLLIYSSNSPFAVRVHLYALLIMAHAITWMSKTTSWSQRVCETLHARWKEEDGGSLFSEIMTQLESPDLHVATLTLINSLILSSLDVSTFYEEMSRLGLRQVVAKIHRNFSQHAALKRQIHLFQTHRLTDVRDDLKTMFDDDDAEHLQLLSDLWNLSFPNSRFDKVSSKWTLLGLVPGNPAASFTSILGLHQMLYFVDKYNDDFQNILKANEARVERGKEMPVGVVGINITFILVDLFMQFLKPGYQEGDLVLPLLFDEEVELFNELYCIIFRRIHVLWTENDTSVLDFNNLRTNLVARLKELISTVENLENFSRELEMKDCRPVLPKWDPGVLMRISGFDDEPPMLSPVTSTYLKKKRTRKLQSFFGENIDVEDTEFWEKIRQAQADVAKAPAIAPQPKNVKIGKLSRFFGQRPELSRHSKKDFDEISVESFDLEEEPVMRKKRSDFKAKKFLGENFEMSEDSTFNLKFQDEMDSLDSRPLRKTQPRTISSTRDYRRKGLEYQVSTDSVDSQSSAKLEQFFGEMTDGRLNFAVQPAHVKPHRIHKKFGEMMPAEAQTMRDPSTRRTESKPIEVRRDRKLHVFFGQDFDVSQVSYTERMRSDLSIPVPEQPDRPPELQPATVSAMKINKMMGTRVELPRRPWNSAIVIDPERRSEQKARRILGEGVHLSDGHGVAYADQPETVSSAKLDKFFGEASPGVGIGRQRLLEMSARLDEPTDGPTSTPTSDEEAIELEDVSGM